MLIAANARGDRIEASRDLLAEDYQCPWCATAVVLKRGKIVIPHFAHTSRLDCPAEGESIRHMSAKRILADQFRALGYGVDLEFPHRAEGRRVDLVATWWDSQSCLRHVAFEIQDSAIAVDKAKERARTDRRLGYLTTVWVFTAQRAAQLIAAAADGEEVRVPDEMRWADSRYGTGIHVIDTNHSTMWNLAIGKVHRDGSSYPAGKDEEIYYPGRTPKTLRAVRRQQVTFRPGVRLSSSNAWSVYFSVS